jgi:hypothetical protein
MDDNEKQIESDTVEIKEIIKNEIDTTTNQTNQTTNQINQTNQSTNQTNETNQSTNQTNETNQSTNQTNETNQSTNQTNTTNTSKKIDLKGFLKNYFYVIIIGFLFIGVIFIGSIGLYLTKIADANILPTDINLAPYKEMSATELQEEIIKRAKIITMNPVKIRGLFGLNIWDDPIQSYSQKAYFDYKEFIDSFDDSWISRLNKYASNPSNSLSNLSLFISKILTSMTVNSFGLITNIYQILNFLPEWLTMLVSLFLGGFILTFINLYNLIIGIIYHIINIKQFFRNSLLQNSEVWEPENYSSWLRITKLILFGILWWWIVLGSILFLTPFYAMFITFYTFLKPLTAKYQLDKGEGKYGFWSFLKDNIIYKKSFLLILTSIGLFRSSSTYLGGNYALGLLIGVVIVGILFGMYNPSIPKNDPTQTYGAKLKTFELKLPNITKQSGGKKNKPN